MCVACKVATSIKTRYSKFCVTIRAHSCYNGIILCNFSWAVAEDRGDKGTQSEIKWVLKVLKNTSSGLFIDVSESSQSAIDVRSLLISCISVSLFLPFYVFDGADCLSKYSLNNTNRFGLNKDSRLKANWLQTSAITCRKKFTFPAHKVLLLFMDNTAKLTEVMNAVTVDHSTVRISTLNQVKSAMHINGYEWNKTQTQISRVAKVEGMTMARVPLKSHKLNYSN